jgi:hypothetical protein
MKRIITHNKNSEPCNAFARMLRGQGHPVKFYNGVSFGPVRPSGPDM